GALFVNALLPIGTSLYAGTNDGVYLLKGGEKQWTAANNELAVRITALAISGANLYAATDFAGVFLTTNNGQSWTPVRNGLTSNARIVNALLAEGATLYAGTMDSVYRSGDSGQNWAKKSVGFLASQINALIVAGPQLLAGTPGGGVFLSTNNGQ